MDSERWARIKQLFAEVLERPPGRRRSWLLETNDTDTALLQEVGSLLEAHERAEGFLSTPMALSLSQGESLEGSLLGPYRIVEEIGSGGMGKVYRAKRDDRAFEKEVAVKVTRASFATVADRERFRAERDILARLEHPHIARLLDGGETEQGLSFLVMELVSGVPITTWVQSHERRVGDVIDLFCTVCEAVHYAHRNLVVHRDIKPSNILVGDDGSPRLLDFGIARLLPEESGSAEPTVGAASHATPEFASPEQIRGEAVTTASDIYSLGVLLYLLLAGQRPYEIDRSRPIEMIKTICETDPDAPSHAIAAAAASAADHDLRRRARQLHGDLDTICLKALAKDPERRYGSAEALADDLRRHQRFLPVRARPDSRLYRLGRFLRRHPLGSAATVAGFFVALGLSAALAVQSARLAQQRDRAQREAARATAVTQFLTDTLSSANPQTGQGRETTVLEVLEAAEQGIAEAFADAPDVEAAVRVTVGDTWASLGRYEEAEVLLRQALASQRVLHGEASLEVAETLRILGDLLRQTGELDEAKEYLSKSLEVKESLLGAEDPRLASTLNDYATLSWTRNEHEDAARYSRRALQILERTEGEKSRDVAQALGNLAVQVEEIGDVEEAVELYHRAIALWRELGDEEHPGHVGAVANLGVLLRVQGRLDEAEPLLRQSLDLDRRIVGDEHPNVAISLVNLADLLCVRGQAAQAESMLLEAITIFDASLGPDHWVLGRTRDRLGVCLTSAGRWEDAEREFRAAYAIMAEKLGATDSRADEALEHLAELYDAWQRPADAALTRARLKPAE